MDDAKLPAPFRIEPLCHLPHSLAKTELIVRPCVALLHASPPTSADGLAPQPSADESLIPRLDAREVAAVFSAPFHNFLRTADEAPVREDGPPLPAGAWYEGSWTHWHETQWRMHYFHVPVHDQKVARPRVREGGLAAIAEQLEEEQETVGRFKVWGMTARILVDAAMVAYG